MCPMTGAVVGGLVAFVLIIIFIVFIMRRKLSKLHDTIITERKGFLYKMDKMEARYRNQCREGT